jgi:hypothetical protein
MKRSVAIQVSAALAVAYPAWGQIATPTLTAESGVYAEAYDVTNRAARRPGQSMRFYASPTLSWMGMDVGTMLMWSTDDQFTAQTQNRYYVNPRWSWGQAHAGDYSPFMSRFTASAVRVRGAGVELSPKGFRVMAAGGVAQDASDLSAFDAAPRRVMYAGLIGYGDPARTYIELSALRAVDDSVGTDSLAVAPQENVASMIGAGVSVGRFRLKGEVGGSLFSRDTRASELDSIATPSAAEGIFTPRVSSRFDLAYSAEARVAIGTGSVGVQVEEVGPGFTTLGNPYLANDKREVRVLTAYRLMRGRLAGSASVGNRSDNLAGDKRGTTNRRTGAFALTLMSGSWLVSSASVMLNALTRTPLPLAPGTPDPGIVDSFRIHNVSRSIGLVEQARFAAAGLPHTVTLSVSSQAIDDASPRFGNTLDASAMSVVGDWSVTVAERLTLSLQPGFERFQGGGRDESFGSIGFGASRRAPRSRWNASVLATHTQVQEGSQLRGNLSTGIRLTPKDQLSFSLRHSRLRGVEQPFTETMGSMRLTRRW